jgi:hypothetical protein
VQRLRYLARTYFHQDYDIETSTPLGVVEAFRADETHAAVAELLADIEEALATAKGEEDLADIWLRQCGSMYNPQTEGQTMRAWFDSMRSVRR